ncbi:ABC transporter permease [Castellaniella sp. GW247-6E4]|uniref:ABC transporter permease n=1 Tax=Castellaniella sp. GW247-6E4 TaxID=3140380 RepID=UPI0033146142
MNGAAHRSLLKPRGLTAAALLAPSSLAVLAVLIGPLFLLFRYSLNQFDPTVLMVEAWSAENYIKFFSDSFYRDVLFRTIYIGVVSTFVCLILGFLPAYFIARTRSVKMKSILIITVILPLLMGNPVRVAGWLVLLGDRGVINSALMSTGVISEPLALLYTDLAVMIGTISVQLPFMIITLQSVIESISPSLEEAALGLGASHWRVFYRVLLPLSTPGIVVGTVLCFMMGMNAYATPVLIGGPTFHMMAPKVYEQITKANNWPFGSAISVILMVTTLLLTIFSSWLVGRISQDRMMAARS